MDDDLTRNDESPSVYARYIGIVELLCPQCGTILRQQTNAKGPWITQCTRAGCQKTWAIGVAIHESKQGFKAPPIDSFWPSASRMLKMWRSGQPINHLSPPPTTT